MLFNFNKFDKTIDALKRSGLDKENQLQPLRKEQLKHSIMQQVAGGKVETKSSFVRYSAQERTISMHKVVRYVGSALAGIVLVAGGTVFAASSAMPGSVLFPVKKAAEHVRIALTPNEEDKAQIQTNIAQDRIKAIDEVQSVNRVTAQVEAQTEVNDAIQTLTDVQTKLEAKGNAQAAASVEANITRLKAMAQNHQLKVEANDNENENSDQNSNDDQNENQQNPDKQDHSDKNKNKSGQVNGASIKVERKSKVEIKLPTGNQVKSGSTTKVEDSGDGQGGDN